MQPCLPEDFGHVRSIGTVCCGEYNDRLSTESSCGSLDLDRKIESQHLSSDNLAAFSTYLFFCLALCVIDENLSTALHY